MSIRKTIGRRIRDKRKSIGLSQEKMAASVGLTATALSFIENGEVYMKTDNLYKICKVLEIKIVELYEGY
ncbi:MAG: helix-turn-helix transcriptional regulator [bacterium]